MAQPPGARTRTNYSVIAIFGSALRSSQTPGITPDLDRWYEYDRHRARLASRGTPCSP
jgi:hypothetical protein